jgi:hypothetical protein
LQASPFQRNPLLDRLSQALAIVTHRLLD